MIPHLSDLFHAIYFIHGKSGLELFSREYTTIKCDVNIITGMFNALETFINHLAYSNAYERLQEIKFHGLTIKFEQYGSKKDPLLCVGVCKTDVQVKALNLQHIIHSFCCCQILSPKVYCVRLHLRRRFFCDLDRILLAECNEGLICIYSVLFPEAGI